uniref:Uncharacterized protein n=1 Tax=Abalone asfa-like virus TaxID=2839893 RepID=A0A5K7XWY8_9VIRU|nr:hypothetical protein [Abalone asfa-like virus]BCY04551.1 hypothetical protein [Abalone asfa-like virus]
MSYYFKDLKEGQKAMLKIGRSRFIIEKRSGITLCFALDEKNKPVLITPDLKLLESLEVEFHKIKAAAAPDKTVNHDKPWNAVIQKPSRPSMNANIVYNP